MRAPLDRRRFLSLVCLAPAAAPVIASAIERPVPRRRLGAALSPGRLVEFDDLAVDPAAERAAIDRIFADAERTLKGLPELPVGSVHALCSSIRPAVSVAPVMPTFADGGFMVDDVEGGP